MFMHILEIMLGFAVSDKDLFDAETVASGALAGHRDKQRSFGRVTRDFQGLTTPTKVTSAPGGLVPPERKFWG